ncbi:hypothetical protein VKT23_000177 [Stygiomarasmius scandens]|uniref:G domain-containing protein n=1 Tax=Marasmiellus scandens TaxID=2682957 RepID=A0ABR1K3B8_9AGAR
MSVPTQNVILFGSTGCGKSSIVNMLLDPYQTQAETSSSAKGCTFRSEPYDVLISDVWYRIFDTAGLDEGSEGAIMSSDALVNLYKLLDELPDGISLLAFVMRGPRITKQAQKNVSIFYEGVCEKSVPIVIIVTGMEDEEPMDAWWMRNERHFQDANMCFDGHACITATRGKETFRGYKNEVEYEESRDLVRDLVREHCRAHGWKQASMADWIPDVYIEKIDVFLDCRRKSHGLDEFSTGFSVNSAPSLPMPIIKTFTMCFCAFRRWKKLCKY